MVLYGRNMVKHKKMTFLKLYNFIKCMIRKTLGVVLLIFCLIIFSSPVLAATVSTKIVSSKIKLPAVPGFSVVQSGNNVVLSWQKPGASIKFDSYIISRSERLGKIGTGLATLARKSLGFTDKKVVVNHTYYYSIKYFAKNAILTNGKQIKIKVVNSKKSTAKLSSQTSKVNSTSTASAIPVAPGSKVSIPPTAPSSPNIFSNPNPTVTQVVDAHASASDLQRLNTLKQLQAALEQYYSDQNAYPAGNGLVLGETQTSCLNSDGWGSSVDCPYPYFGTIPKDPGSGSYFYTATDSSYTISATLDGKANGYSGTITMTPGGIVAK